MKIVSVNDSKVCVPKLEDANQLMQALIRYNCEGSIQKYDSTVEDDQPGDYILLFDDFEVNIVNKKNTETVIDWLLTLGVTDILVKRANV